MVNHSDISLYLQLIYRCNRTSNCVQESQSGVVFIGIKPHLKIGPFIHSHSNKYKTPLYSYTKQWEISRLKLTHGIKYFEFFLWVHFLLYYYFSFFFLVQHIFPFCGSQFRTFSFQWCSTLISTVQSLLITSYRWVCPSFNL